MYSRREHIVWINEDIFLRELDWEIMGTAFTKNVDNSFTSKLFFWDYLSMMAGFCMNVNANFLTRFPLLATFTNISKPSL